MSPLTWGVLSPGDLGSAVGGLLRDRGHRTVTTLEGRSARTRERCERAGLEVLPGLREVVAEADVVISLVPPEAALPLARRVASGGARKPGQLYVDANSLALRDLRAVAAIVTSSGGRFLDAAFHGAAAYAGQDRLRDSTSVFLAGEDVERIAGALSPPLRVVRLGTEPGRATALKLLISTLNKGMSALFAEAGAAAARAGLLDETLEALRFHHPQTTAELERMLPSYARHARRRAIEMEGLADLLREVGVEPEMAAAAARRIARMAGALSEPPPGAALQAGEMLRALGRKPEGGGP